MEYPRNTFPTNKITNEIEQPQIFACDRQLHRKGEIYPVSDIRIKKNLNGADEISFTVTKNVKIIEDSDLEELKEIYGDNIQTGIANMYDELQDYSVVFARGFGYFEVSPTISDKSNMVKTLSGNALGETELSQLLCTLVVNTDEEIENTVKLNKEFIPTVFYKADDKEHSLLHRILTYAPNYEIGHVDESLMLLQRTYSWENSDIMSVLNDIAKEINCIFRIDVYLDELAPKRVVNAYDAQYCENCHGRHIVNGECQDCYSTDIGGVGENTNIHISTDSLSEEITVTPDGNMKNCFIVQGGDEVMTDTVSGIQPSGNNKVYMFSEETMNQFSESLYEAYMQYMEDYADNEDEYAELLEGEYDIFDLILYLQSGRMPTIETDKRDIFQEVDNVLMQFYFYFPNGLATIKDIESVESNNGTVRSIISVLLDDGYAVKQSGVTYDSDNHIWRGTLTIYEIQNNDNKIDLIFDTNNVQAVLYNDSPSGTEYTFTGNFKTVTVDGETQYSAEVIDEDDNTICLNPNYREDISGTTSQWHVQPMQFTENYETYVKQSVAIMSEKYIGIEDQSYNNEKEWQKYSLNRLKSFYNGYMQCISTIDEMTSEYNGEGYIPPGTSAEQILLNMRETYVERIQHINPRMWALTDFIYHLYSFFGTTSKTANTALPSEMDIDYNNYTPHFRWTNNEWAVKLVNYIKKGNFDGTGSDNTDKAICCLNCNSTNVTLTSCLNCGSTNIATYGTEAEFVKTLRSRYTTSLEKKRQDIADLLNLEKSLGADNYSELLSYVREEVYQNSNYISSGLGNTELLINARELVEQAKKQLASACVSQHTISGNIFAFMAIAKETKIKLDPPNDDGTIYTSGSVNAAMTTLDTTDTPEETANEATVPLYGGLDREIGLYGGVPYIPFPVNTEIVIDYEQFRLGNYIHYICDGKRYKLRLSSMEFSWEEKDISLNVEFTDEVHYLNGTTSDIASMMAQVDSLSTSFNYVESQSLDGATAKNELNKISEEGLLSAMDNALSASSQSALINDRGILLRKWNYDTNNWDPHQMKIIDRNIVMTDDAWESAKLAIGLGSHNGSVVYGVWAELLFGNLILGNEMQIFGDGSEYPAEIIDKDGIRLFASKPSTSGVALPTNYGIFTIYNYNSNTSSWDKVVDIDDSGNASYAGNVEASSGHIGIFAIEPYWLDAISSNYNFHIGASNVQPGNPYVGLANLDQDIDLRMTMNSFVAKKSVTEGEGENANTFNVTTAMFADIIRLYDQLSVNSFKITRKGFELMNDDISDETPVAKLDENGKLSVDQLDINWKQTSVIPDNYSQMIVTVSSIADSRVWNLGTFVKAMVDGYSGPTKIECGNYTTAYSYSGCVVEIDNQSKTITLVKANINEADVTVNCALEVYYS